MQSAIIYTERRGRQTNRRQYHDNSRSRCSSWVVILCPVFFVY